MPHHIGDILKQLRDHLVPVSEGLAIRDAEQIIEHTLSIPRNRIYTDHAVEIEDTKYQEMCHIAEKRLRGTPLPYILGSTYFYSKKFFVTPDVLIPRPDTEIVIDALLQNEIRKNISFLDMGVGSGIIAESIAQERPAWKAFAVDISIPALRIAKENCSQNISLFCGDRLSALKNFPALDIIVSNPPYISKTEMNKLDKSVTEYEPYLCLYGGDDGLDFYRYLAKNGKSFLKENGSIYCEIGYNQEKSVRRLFTDSGWTDIKIHHDLAGRPRVASARKN